MKKHFQSSHKVTNIASTDITLTSLLQYLDTFYLLYVLEESDAVTPKRRILEKGVLKTFTKLTGKPLGRCRCLFCNKAASMLFIKC